MGRKYTILLTVCTLYVNYIFATEIVNKNIIFKNVERNIDLTSQLVKIVSTVTIENSGSNQIKNIIWALDHGATGKLSFISAKDNSRRDLQVKETHVEKKIDGQVFYSVSLHKPSDAKKIVLTVEEVYTGSQMAYPASITQKEKQLVRYFGNHYLFSPYTVSQQTTKIQFGTKNIENYSKLKPSNLGDGIIVYGPYENIHPYTEDKLTVHYENNSPFLTVTELKRNIEVSHWGNIAIEEDISLLHTGAALKGSFSRYDFQRENSGLNSVKSFKTILPAAAERPYYRDFNGNISTSNMRLRKDSVELDLRPRFPLFGGWKTCYTLGYSVPSYQYLFHKGDTFLLKIRLIDHVFDDMQVDDLVTTIVLPVGATNIELKTPFTVERLTDSVAYKYLDTKGRPVISFKKSNLVENHIQDLQLTYQWPRVLMVHEPILLAVVLYALFVLVIVYVRLDFSIISNDPNKKQQ